MAQKTYNFIKIRKKVMPVFFDRHLLSLMMIIIVPEKIKLFKVDLLHLYRYLHLVWGDDE